MQLSDRVRFRREQLKMTQDELAAKMGYKSRTSINKIEMGRPVSQKIVARLADALDTNISYLMGWEEEKPTANYDGLTEGQKKLIALGEGLSDDQIDLIIQVAKTILGRVQ